MKEIDFQEQNIVQETTDVIQDVVIQDVVAQDVTVQDVVVQDVVIQDVVIQIKVEVALFHIYKKKLYIKL